MKCAKIASLALVCVMTLGSLNGCTTVSKVQRTLALNDLHMQAAVAEDKGDDAVAYELWTEYVTRRPNSILGEFRLGMVESRLGKFNQAAGHLRVAHDLKPGNIEYIEALADALLNANRISSMMNVLRQTIDEGETGSGLLRLAHFSQQAGQMDEAREALLLAVAQDQGQSPVAYLAMADFANALGDTQTEIEYLRYVLWFDQSDPSTLERLTLLGMIAGPSLAVAP